MLLEVGNGHTRKYPWLLAVRVILFFSIGNPDRSPGQAAEAGPEL